MFEHFGLVAGQALPADYPSLSGDDLRRHLSALPAGETPRLTTDLDILTEDALKLGLGYGSQDVVELRAVFASLLTGSNPAQESIRELLDSRGVPITDVSESTQRWVQQNEKVKYRDWLIQTLPFDPTPVDVPNYKADHGRQFTPADDFVDLRAEVDAFAYLLASRGLDPPLAVGLFGDWGSGKTFFMNALRHRIDRLATSDRAAERPQSEVPFWKHIVQVEFNAWNYVEGELLASLVEEVFSQLRLASDGEADQASRQLAERQKHWLTQLESNRLALERIQAERRENELQLDSERRRAEQLRSRYDLEVAELERLRSQRVGEVVLTDSQSALSAALEPVAVTLAGPTAGNALQALGEARRELNRGRALISPITKDVPSLLILLGALVLTPLIVWGVSTLDVSAVVPVFAGLASAIALALPVLKSSTAWLQKRIDRVEAAEKLVDGEIRAASAELQKQVAMAEARASKTQVGLRAATNEEDRLVAELARIDGELDKTPVQLLGEFIGERVGSSDYRERLGVPALIRHDFDMLSRLIKNQNRDLEQEGKASQDPNVINRIILYIDDLDRCPEEKVIEVLQAVHLLLAFELFVVVVAVDSRWLADALDAAFSRAQLQGRYGEPGIARRLPGEDLPDPVLDSATLRER